MLVIVGWGLSTYFFRPVGAWYPSPSKNSSSTLLCISGGDISNTDREGVRLRWRCRPRLTTDSLRPSPFRDPGRLGAGLLVRLASLGRPSLAFLYRANHSFSLFLMKVSIHISLAEFCAVKSSSLMSNSFIYSPLVSLKNWSTCWSFKSCLSPTTSGRLSRLLLRFAMNAGRGKPSPPSGARPGEEIPPFCARTAKLSTLTVLSRAAEWL
jgi:hypothetical protein